MVTRTEILGRVPISRGKYNEQEMYYMQNIVLYANGSYMVCVPEITGIPPIDDEGNLNDGWDVNNAIPVVQKPGENEQVVMSQKAVTETYGDLVENPEYIEVTVDAEGKVLEGIKADGQKYLGKPSNQDEILQQQINNISETVTEDLQEKVDNAVTEINTKVNDAVEQLDEKLENLPFESIENPEYMDVTLDLEDKVLEGITTDGVKQVNIPHSFNRPVTFNDEIEMGEKGQSSIINIIRNSGINFDQITDWSKTKELRLPEPKVCAIVNIICEKLPTSKIGASGAISGVNCKLPAELEYWDKLGNYFRKPIIISAQGDSSLGAAIKNFGFDLDDGSEIKFGNWVPQDSFHLKAFWIDNFAGICDVGYKYYDAIIEHLGWRANRLQYKTDEKISAFNSSGNVETDWHSDALCHPDGFPFELYHNGNYVKLYAWNLKKHRANYSMKKNDYKSVLFDGKLGNDCIWEGNIRWDQFELKNPKTLITVEIEEKAGYAYQAISDADEITAAQATEYYETTDKPTDWTTNDLTALFGKPKNYPAYAYRTSKDKWYKLIELAGYAFKKYDGDFPKELVDDKHHYYDENLKHYGETDVLEFDNKIYSKIDILQKANELVKVDDNYYSIKTITDTLNKFYEESEIQKNNDDNKFYVKITENSIEVIKVDSKYYEKNSIIALTYYVESDIREIDNKFYLANTVIAENGKELEELCVFNPNDKDQANTLITKNEIIRISNAYADINSQTTTELKRKKFLEYFDKENCILYHILSNIYYNNDGWYKNWIWVLYNRICVPTLYDLDSIFGKYPGSGNFVHPKSLTDILNGGPISLCYNLFKQDFKDTYKKLVDDGFINVKYIMSFVKDWVNRAGIDAYKRMYEKYNNIPSYKESTFNTEYWESYPEDINYWSKTSFTSIPEDQKYNNTKQYNIGDFCYKNVGNNQALKCVCIKECQGIAPFETYGFYDSVERIEKWLTIRLQKTHNYYGYTTA